MSAEEGYAAAIADLDAEADRLANYGPLGKMSSLATRAAADYLRTQTESALPPEPKIVTGVWLRRHGGAEDDPLAEAIVAIEIDGQWHDVITERLHGNFSHIAEVQNLNLAEYPCALRPAEAAC